jgi:hypothetical protein
MDVAAFDGESGLRVEQVSPSHLLKKLDAKKEGGGHCTPI